MKTLQRNEPMHKHIQLKSMEKKSWLMYPTCCGIEHIKALVQIENKDVLLAV